jgi:hypothetical protein
VELPPALSSMPLSEPQGPTRKCRNRYMAESSLSVNPVVARPYRAGLPSSPTVGVPRIDATYGWPTSAGEQANGDIVEVAEASMAPRTDTRTRPRASVRQAQRGQVTMNGLIAAAIELRLR